MTKNIFLALALIIGLNAPNCTAQKKSKEKTNNRITDTLVSPKLVVGIIVDQMRYDYITRFYSHFGDGGFRRMMRDGFNCRNNHFNYARTSTAPGHASVYTGTTPSVHGIIGNDWYDKDSSKMVYCVNDTLFNSIGTASEAGEVSPHRLNVSTLTDQLRLHHQMRSKVISIAIKDRAAVLSGGHTANAAYWFHGHSEGTWVSSSFYMDQLPEWVRSFNASGAAETYKRTWNTLKNINLYKESGTDNNSYEAKFDGEFAPVFPHNLPVLWEGNNQFELLKSSPFGNSLTTDFAIAALANEELGQDETTDFLAISYSSTDLVGHRFGVNSKEVQDTYLRLDLDLERLLAALDREVGKGQYTVFLTADHGAMHVSNYLKDQKIPAGIHNNEEYNSLFPEFLKYKYGTTDILEYGAYGQLYLNHKVIANLDLDLRQVQESIARELLSYEGIDKVYTAYQLENTSYAKGISNLLQNSYHQKRSGDVLYFLKPGYSDYSKTGSTHGTPYIYDTHVPLMFYGKGIRKGSTVGRTEITDVAPTISALLGIAFPGGSTGAPIVDILK